MDGSVLIKTLYRYLTSVKTLSVTAIQAFRKHISENKTVIQNIYILSVEYSMSLTSVMKGGGCGACAEQNFETLCNIIASMSSVHPGIHENSLINVNFTIKQTFVV